MLHSKSRRRGLTLLEMLIVLVIMVALGTMMIPSLSWIGQNSQRVSTQENLARLRELLVNKYYVDMGQLPRPRADMIGADPKRVDNPQLVYLFVNPDTFEDTDTTTSDLYAPTNVLSGRRWQGPYLMHSGSEFYATDSDSDLGTGTNFTRRYGKGVATTKIGDPTVVDAWGAPIVIQEPLGDGSTTLTALERRQYTRLVSAGRNGILDTPPDTAMPTLTQRQDDVVLFLFRHDEFGDVNLEMNQ